MGYNGGNGKPSNKPKGQVDAIVKQTAKDYFKDWVQGKVEEVLKKEAKDLVTRE